MIDTIRKNKKAFKVFVAVLFVGLFLIGLSNTKDYGRPIDEQMEQKILLMNAKEYASILGIPAQNPVYTGIKRISESIEMDHGIAGYYLFLPIIANTGRDTLTTTYAWHYYTYCLWFLGVIALYLTLKELCTSSWTPPFVTLIYFFSPRIFAESHYNNKDIILLTYVLILFLFVVRMSIYGRTRDMIFFAIISGFLMNCKIIGIAVWGLTVIFLAGDSVLGSRRGKWTDIFLAAIFSIIMYFLLTPAIWRFPIGYIQYCLTNAASFSRWGKTFLFHSVTIKPSVTGVPRTYLLEWIWMTTPVYVTVLFLTSAAVAGRVVKNGKSENMKFYILFLLTFLLPVLYSIIRAPKLVLYNGWRHNYYLYAPMILCCAYAVDRVMLAEKPWNRSTAGVVIAAALLFTVTDMTVNRSYEYMYFNPMARGTVDAEGFEGDYWNVAEMQTVKALDEFLDAETTVAFHGYAADGQLKNVQIGNVRVVGENQDPEYVIINTSMPFDENLTAELEQVFEVRKYGRSVAAVYSRKELL